MAGINQHPKAVNGESYKVVKLRAKSSSYPHDQGRLYLYGLSNHLLKVNAVELLDLSYSSQKSIQARVT
jgi:hypothetical protein